MGGSRSRYDWALPTTRPRIPQSADLRPVLECVLIDTAALSFECSLANVWYDPSSSYDSLSMKAVCFSENKRILMHEHEHLFEQQAEEVQQWSYNESCKESEDVLLDQRLIAIRDHRIRLGQIVEIEKSGGAASNVCVCVIKCTLVGVTTMDQGLALVSIVSVFTTRFLSATDLFSCRLCVVGCKICKLEAPSPVSMVG